MQSITVVVVGIINQILLIMKKTLLCLTSIMLFSVSAIYAQTTSWTFDNTTTWPTAGLVSGGPTVVIEKLGCVPHNGTSTNTFAAQQALTIGYSDGTSYTSIIKTNGSGGAVNYRPVLRYFYFNIDGNATVKVWFRHGSTSTTGTRTLFLTNEGSPDATLVGSTPVEMGAAGILNYTTTTGAGKYYLYGDNSLYISKIEVTGANVTTPALSTKDFQKELDITVYAKDSKIFLSNIKSSTNIEVYNVLGALVKSAQAEADTSLDINSGVYIVKAKSSEGEKAVKVMVQ